MKKPLTVVNAFISKSQSAVMVIFTAMMGSGNIFGFIRQFCTENSGISSDSRLYESFKTVRKILVRLALLKNLPAAYVKSLMRNEIMALPSLITFKKDDLKYHDDFEKFTFADVEDFENWQKKQGRWAPDEPVAEPEVNEGARAEAGETMHGESPDIEEGPAVPPSPLIDSVMVLSALSTLDSKTATKAVSVLLEQLPTVREYFRGMSASAIVSALKDGLPALLGQVEKLHIA